MLRIPSDAAMVQKSCGKQGWMTALMKRYTKLISYRTFLIHLLVYYIKRICASI